jgi:type II secretory pathway pseudopilin PulG
MKEIKNKKGFTLVETILAITITLLIIGATLEMFKGTLKTGDALYANLNSQGEIRKALKSISANIRSASPSSLGAYPIDSAATSSFIFYSDIDNDGLKERIRYFLDSGSLKEGVIKPNDNPLIYNENNEEVHSLLNNLTNTSASPIFEYYGSDYDGTTAPLPNPVAIADIRLVKITALVNQNPKAPVPNIMEFITQISIRNLKDNF